MNKEDMKDLLLDELVGINTAAEDKFLRHILSNYGWRWFLNTPILDDSCYNGKPVAVVIKNNKYIEEYKGITRVDYLTTVDDFIKKYEVPSDELMEYYLAELETGDKLYSPFCGDIVFLEYDSPYYKFTKYQEEGTNFIVSVTNDGKINKDGQIIIFPSYELYQKYPTEPISAWAIWRENRVPKPWRAKYGEHYYIINSGGIVESSLDCEKLIDEERWKIGNYFKNLEDANSAAEKFIEMLKSFRNEKSKSNVKA